MKIKPDIIGQIYFYTPDEGGLSNPIGGGNLNCSIKIDGKLYDVRVFIEQGRYFNPGEKAELPIKFLCYDNVKCKIELGKTFHLKSLNKFAKGTIVKIIT